MNARMEKVMQDFENKQLGVDKPFEFHCTMCGKCCINREDILLNPKDLFNLARELRLTTKEVVTQYCECYIGADSRLPVVRLKPRGSIKRCPLLKDRKCSVHKAKPTVCALFPLGRGIAVEKGDIGRVTTADIRYFFTDPGCGNKTETHTVRDWLGTFGIPMQDEFFVEWQQCVMALSMKFRELEKKSDRVMGAIWDSTLIVLYMTYDVDREFEPQFKERVANLQKMIAVLEAELTDGR